MRHWKWTNGILAAAAALRIVKLGAGLNGEPGSGEYRQMVGYVHTTVTPADGGQVKVQLIRGPRAIVP